MSKNTTIATIPPTAKALGFLVAASCEWVADDDMDEDDLLGKYIADQLENLCVSEKIIKDVKEMIKKHKANNSIQKELILFKLNNKSPMNELLDILKTTNQITILRTI